ncbi:MAG: UDP-N-acetylmuramoyl-L-alanyl-D-glutamate--2,6-diaminopimelate ligase [Bacteroidales bacterium]
MTLNDIIQELEIVRRSGEGNPAISAVAFDSRKVGEGDLFVAIRGGKADGHRFISKVMEAGAAVIVGEEAPPEETGKAVWLQVPESRRALALLAAAFYGHPSKELQLVGVTGTNGKTTIVTLLHQLHGALGYRAGLLSTIRVKIGEEDRPATHTTPDPVQINAALRTMVDEGCEYCFMEVSSHAVDQERTAGLHFIGGVFTNLTRDHLDYHPDFNAYLTAKKRFFDQLSSESFALVNADDKHGQVMLQNCSADTYCYSLRSLCDFTGKINEMHLEGTGMTINETEVWVNLPGRFNASNLLAVYGVSVLLGHHREELIRTLSQLKPVEGRFQIHHTAQGPSAVVDYAHTPDALERVLETLQEVNVKGGQIITVVGAGGNRDRGKRPAMARIAAEGSGKVILTSDNPRDEDPEMILDDMMEGIPEQWRDRALRIVNRREAIRTACMLAGADDIILVAGKGHEKTQEIMGEKLPFDDMEILQQNLNG